MIKQGLAVMQLAWPPYIHVNISDSVSAGYIGAADLTFLGLETGALVRSCFLCHPFLDRRRTGNILKWSSVCYPKA